VNEHSVLSTRKGYPLHINVAHSLAACISHRQSLTPDSDASSDTSSKSARPSLSEGASGSEEASGSEGSFVSSGTEGENDAEDAERIEKPRIPSVGSALGSYLISLTLFGFGGNLAANLLVFVRTPTFFTHQVFLVHLLAWLLVNFCPWDIFWRSYNSFPILRTIIAVLDAIDGIYTHIGYLTLSFHNDSQNVALFLATGLSYSLGGAAMRRYHQFAENRDAPWHKFMDGRTERALINALIIRMALIHHCGFPKVRTKLEDWLGYLWILPSTVCGISDHVYSVIIWLNVLWVVDFRDVIFSTINTTGRLVSLSPKEKIQ